MKTEGMRLGEARILMIVAVSFVADSVYTFAEPAGQNPPCEVLHSAGGF